MTELVILGAAIAVGLAAYYVRLHVEWRREVRRRRADRAREREFLRRVELDPPRIGRIGVEER